MKRRRGNGNESMSTSGWMTTFSDLCTLLLTFFVLLFSMRSMDDQKLKIALRNFGGSSGVLSFRDYREISNPLEVLIRGLHSSLGEKVVVGTGKSLRKADLDTRGLEGVGSLLLIKTIKGGVELVFGQKLLFPPGSDEIREEMKPALEKVARFISISGYQAYIDGHTDNIPIRNDMYTSNEELSIARAFSIRNYLLWSAVIPPDTIALTGYGAIKPVAANDLEEGRGKNRRVAIILKSQSYF